MNTEYFQVIYKEVSQTGLLSNTHMSLFITFKNLAPVQHYPSANSPDIPPDRPILRVLYILTQKTLRRKKPIKML